MGRGDRREDVFKRDGRTKGGTNRCEWKESELDLQSKGDKAKIAVAKRLRKETTMTLKWLAWRLQVGSWAYVFNLLASNWVNSKDKSVNSENRPLYGGGCAEANAIARAFALGLK